MASFVEGLWQSIFTPGPTPTLLVATNVTFAALQAVLAGMLYATHSIHFFVLSVLCGGLWAAINWFARELKAHQQQEEAEKEKQEKEKQEKEKEKKRRTLPSSSSSSPPRASSEDSETEVEAAAAAASSASGLRRVPTVAPAAVSTEVEPAEARGELKLRVAEEPLSSPSQGQRSGVSTEDEWEKVSENEKDR